MKHVMITIVGMQTQNGDSDKMEFVTEGEYEYSDGGVSSLSYMESALTGMEGTKTDFAIEKDSVTLTREGTVTSQMLFRLGKKHVFVYSTPYGATTLGVSTKKLSVSVGEDGGHMDIHYALDVDNCKIGDNTFTIDFHTVMA